MADGITGEILGGREIVVRLDNYTPRVRANVRQAINRMQYVLQRLIKENLRGGNPLHVRSGKLSESIAVAPIQESENEIRGPVGTNTIYARIQEYGGTITPKSAQFLTIPLDAAKTAAGVLKWSARQIIESPGSGGFEGTFFKRGILFGKESGGSIVPLFVLKTSVTLRPRPFMAPALSAVKKDYETALRKALDRAKDESGL